MKKCSEYIKKALQGMSSKGGKLKRCLHCSLLLLFLYYVAGFCRCPFFLCLGDQSGSEKGTLKKCSKYMKKALQGMSSRDGKCFEVLFSSPPAR